MRIRGWHIGRNDSRLHGISDGHVLEQFNLSLQEKKKNELVLVGVTAKGERVWSLEEELREMRGHLFGLIRSRYGREMLDARKLAMAERFGLGGMRRSVTSTAT